jgi:starch phosphorylase
MDNFQTYQVFPTFPEQLSFLEVLSRNLWWSWKPDSLALFNRIDPELWEESGQNPIVFSTLISQKRLDELANDDSFLAHIQRVKKRFEKRILAPIDRSRSPYGQEGVIAYFSMEFGIHENLPLFAGGLGILAGDYLKAASHMALPVVGVGLLYQHGYFRQFLDKDGWQQEEYPETDLYNLPLERVKDHSGKEVRVSIAGPEGEIHAEVWKVDIGRIPLYLLDTNLIENSPQDRDITSSLYAGGPKRRLTQEVVLGVGGMRALAAMGLCPKVCHMNEGHCTFATLERLAQIILSYGVDLKAALEIVPRTTVFTTHTPVAAGYDEFPADLVKPYLRPMQKYLGVTEKEILSWGQSVESGPDGPFSMFILGLRLAQYCNGVSELHGKVARKMWSHIWPNRSEDEVPITHITNGIHVSSFISREIALLFERYLGPDWHMSSRKPENIKRIGEIFDDELWRAHEMSRSDLVRTVRNLMVKQYGRRNAPKAIMKQAESVLDQNALTIVFARRFTTYKRAYLLLQDTERLEAILHSEEYPVQIIFAGKAHPKDNEGKKLIQRIVRFAGGPTISHRIVFLENYDMHMARHLVQGADVWLNTPRRPLEACGTSGMKAAINGVLNLSILDGWWCEGYSEKRGWCIGNGEEYSDHSYQDIVESQALYNLLENDVIPCFYERNNGNIPQQWVSMMKESIKMAMQDYCSMRMVGEYEKRFYIPAAKSFNDLIANNAEKAGNLAIRHKRFRDLWNNISISRPVRDSDGPFRVGDSFRVTAEVFLGELRPDEVEVLLCYGHMKSMGCLGDARTEQMTVCKELGEGRYLYECTITCNDSGRYGFTARVEPRADDWIKVTPGLITPA